MKRRYSLRALLIWIAAVAIALALLPDRNDLTKQDFLKLRPGMSFGQVEARLKGEPRRDIPRATVWVPRESGGDISMMFESRTPMPDFFPGRGVDGGYQAVWVTRTGLIAAYFGPDNRLQRKFFSSVHQLGPPTLADWMASRPREIAHSLGLGQGR